MLFSTAEIIAVPNERPENRHSGVLLPYRFMQIVDAEMFLIPFSQARDICCSEEYATNSNGSAMNSSRFARTDAMLRRRGGNIRQDR